MRTKESEKPPAERLIEERNGLLVLEGFRRGTAILEILEVPAGEIDAVGVVRLAGPGNPAEIGDVEGHVLQAAIDVLRKDVAHEPMPVGRPMPFRSAHRRLSGLP